jgi:SAM-dependent methyltransferase
MKITGIDWIPHFIKFHRNQSANNADDYHALGWRSPESQLLRFKALTSGMDLQYSSILDVGCGYADFKTFLDKSFDGVSYTGIDLVPEFVHEAARRFASDRFCSFIHGDFFITPLTEVDYVFSCGALCYRNTDPEFVYKMIRNMWNTGNKGIAFNLLNKAVFPKHPLLVGYDKDEVLDYCQLLTSNIIVEEGYLPDDFIIKLLPE